MNLSRAQRKTEREKICREVARRGDVIHSYKYQTSGRGGWRDRGARASNH